MKLRDGLFLVCFQHVTIYLTICIDATTCIDDEVVVVTRQSCKMHARKLLSNPLELLKIIPEDDCAKTMKICGEEGQLPSAKTLAMLCLKSEDRFR